MIKRFDSLVVHIMITSRKYDSGTYTSCIALDDTPKIFWSVEKLVQHLEAFKFLETCVSK